MSAIQVTASDLLQARKHLSQLIRQRAISVALEPGLAGSAFADAPSRYLQLQDAFNHPQRTGDPLPISSEDCDDVIYTPVGFNGALCFWPDLNHVRRRLDFGLVDELELSLLHLGAIVGHDPGTLVWCLLHADIARQAYVQAVTCCFHLDQRRFVSGCVTSGFDHGLLAALGRGQQT